METYAQVLQPILTFGWVAFWIIVAAVVVAGLYIGGAELYDAIRKNRFSWSYIWAAPMVVAGFVVSLFIKQKPGRHADGHVVFWTEILDEAIKAPYSLTRTENNVHALKYATHA